jgi:hypothetical protein
VPEAKLQSPPAVSSADEAELLARLRDGDERAFEALVDRHYGTMLAVARGYVKSRAVAEEVVQEAWLGVLKGLDRFEGRSSLRARGSSGSSAATTRSRATGASTRPTGRRCRSSRCSGVRRLSWCSRS